MFILARWKDENLGPTPVVKVKVGISISYLVYNCRGKLEVSLNGREPLVGDAATLRDLGLVSGDRLHVILPGRFVKHTLGRKFIDYWKSIFGINYICSLRL